MSELTALSALLELAAGDLLYVVDVSDTGGSADGTSKKVAISSLGGRFLIETIDNTVTPGEFDFNSIPTGFNRLIIKGYIRGDVASDGEAVHLYFNADTTNANYHFQRIGAINGVGNSDEGDSPMIMNTTGAASPANAFGDIDVSIENYTGPNLKTARAAGSAYTATDVQKVYVFSVVSSITAAITRVRLRGDNHPTDELYGLLRLYGEF